MKYPRTWEDLSLLINRLKVPGGWIVRTSRADGNDACQSFLPDPNHEWDLEDER